MDTTSLSLSRLAQLVVSVFEEKDQQNTELKVQVNPLVSKVASWYEKIRKAMEYREEEVLLRATIERILKRRLLLGGNAKTTAEPLIRELLWAGYLPENSIPQSIVATVEESIDLHLSLRLKVLEHHRMDDRVLNEWMYQLMSSDIEHILNPNKEKETIANFMFHILKNHVTITDDTEETRDAQVYLAVRKAFARDDIAFQRYNLLKLYFGQLTRENVDDIAARFLDGYWEVVKEMKYPRKDRVYAYVKKRAAAFLILEDVLHEHRDSLKTVLRESDSLQEAVLTACEKRYKSIASKVRRAIVRSVLFILLTKVLFAFFIEGTYERLVYGEILWGSIAINTTMPPLLMVIVSLFIRTPDRNNSNRILVYIQKILYDEDPKLGNMLTIKKAQDKAKPITIIFTLLWLFAFLLTFGGLIYILSLLHLSFISQFIFIFFLTIVSFLSYRIVLTANMYKVGDRQGLFTPVADFLFMPIIRVGRRLTTSISQVNFLLFFFDFFIETPFKVIFAFFEQWFHFLSAKREEME
jgi:hypothetical protein